MKTRKVRQRQWVRYLKRYEARLANPDYPPIYVERRYDKMFREVNRVHRKRMLRRQRNKAKAFNQLLEAIDTEMRTRYDRYLDEAVWGPGGYEVNKDRSSIKGILQ